LNPDLAKITNDYIVGSSPKASPNILQFYLIYRAKFY
jgi:hypothetical protein